MTTDHIADLILINGHVITMAPDAEPQASTIVVQGGIIRAVGDTGLVSQHRGPKTRVIDCTGLSVTPGLIDAHSHPVLGAERAIGLDLGGVVTPADLLSRLRSEADRITADGGDQWLRAWNLDYAAFDGLTLSAGSIEGAIRGLPALILFFDGHTALASRRALFRSGIWGAFNFADNSRVVLDGTGSPTGELREDGAIDLVLAHVPALSDTEVQGLARTVLSGMSSVGLTGLCAMDGTVNTLEVIRSIASEGEGLPLRIVTAFDHHPGDDHALIAERISTFGAAQGPRWRAGLVKIYADGVIDTGTGWLYEPDLRGEGTTAMWGDPRSFLQTMMDYSRGGVHIATHAIGDRAVGATIDAYLACGVRSARGAPHRIEHIECLTDTDLLRLASSQITASVQPSHLQWRKEDGTDEWASRLGADRTNRAWRAGDLFAAGVPVAFGSDWPVAQFDPRVSMAWSQLRRKPGDSDAPVFERGQRCTSLQALHAYTVGAARAQGDRDLGRIVEGFQADFTLWAVNPLAVDPDDLISTPIEATIVGGHATFSTPGSNFSN